jgi:hypothetical protein
MKASSVRKGFRRIAFALVIPFAVATLGGFGVALYNIATMPTKGIIAHGPDFKMFVFKEGTPREIISAALSKEYGRRIIVDNNNWTEDTAYLTSNQMWAWNNVSHALFFSSCAAALGVIAFVLAWTLGWIIRGFASEP